MVQMSLEIIADKELSFIVIETMLTDPSLAFLNVNDLVTTAAPIAPAILGHWSMDTIMYAIRLSIPAAHHISRCLSQCPPVGSILVMLYQAKVSPSLTISEVGFEV